VRVLTTRVRTRRAQVVGMITRQDLIVAMETHRADGPSSHHHDANMM
jgi:hypothetical protein